MTERKNFTASDPGFAARVAASFARQGIMTSLGARLTRIEPGLCEIQLPYRPELSQQHGFFHAGVTSTIADSAGGYAGFTLFPADSDVLTVEFKINLLAPADGDLLIATGRVIRSGRTLTVCELEVEVEKAGRRTACAHGLQTLITIVNRSSSQN
ncbi:MAG TPA: PaaI family thioesterase [Aliidongia sp.]|uniref:PaaI family thioesterase n=1 Tax=Aliidongia sp. TaxID=1914230 RepID=UPI002DDCC0B7|nr:PaaI family thioesterase [Aliidongia sp.]HEV2675795.1 PaaI family thioesterase [Aliidongia sp.]